MAKKELDTESGDKTPHHNTGNEFWKYRSSHGRKPIFESPEQLWDAACEYFEWATKTTLKEKKLFMFQGEVIEGTVEHPRAFTIGALCLYLDISDQTFQDYGKRDDFIGIVEHIKQTIYQQKFSGAVAGLMNSNIIARDLKLKDTSEVDLNATGITFVNNYGGGKE